MLEKKEAAEHGSLPPELRQSASKESVMKAIESGEIQMEEFIGWLNQAPSGDRDSDRTPVRQPATTHRASTSSRGRLPSLWLLSAL